jgi:tetratricopeptide (TPR) repeat protein
MLSYGKQMGKWVLILAGAVGFAAPAFGQNVRLPAFQRNLLEPGDPARDLFNEGQRFYDQSRFGDAERTFRQVTERYPRSTVADRAEYYLIRTLRQTGKTVEALNHINSFRKTYPNSTWNLDVEEEKMEITNQIPAAAQAILIGQSVAPLRPVPPRPAAPRPVPPHPPAIAVQPVEIQNFDLQISFLQEAMRVMFRNDASRALQIATERLKADMADPVVISSMSILVSNASAQGLPILVEIAKNSPDMRARKDAAYWMTRVNSDKDRIVDTLMGLLPTDDNTDGVTYALGQIRTEKSFNALAGIVTDKSRSEKVRTQALVALGQAHDPRTVALLANIANGDSELRTEALRWLGQIRSPAAMQVLENLKKK